MSAAAITKTLTMSNASTTALGRGGGCGSWYAA